MLFVKGFLWFAIIRQFIWTISGELTKGTEKVPVNLIKWMKVAHSFLQSVSDQFHVIILSLPM